MESAKCLLATQNGGLEFLSGAEFVILWILSL